MVKVYETNKAGELVGEREYISVRDFKPALFATDMGHFYWRLWVSVTFSTHWSCWSQTRRDWVVVMDSDIPKILLMRQLTGAL
jgi:hypothetical protein